MNKRPHSITIVAWVFVAAGIIGFVYHASEFDFQRPFGDDVLLVCFVRLLAILFGVFALRGHDWARWGLAGWLLYHVILSAFHTPFELVVHGVLLVVVVYILFRPRASAFFQGRSADVP
jgi:hypothetical protein